MAASLIIKSAVARLVLAVTRWQASDRAVSFAAEEIRKIGMAISWQGRFQKSREITPDHTMDKVLFHMVGLGGEGFLPGRCPELPKK